MNLIRPAAKIFFSNWKKFYNQHKGESCYIFGDGPSIKWFDLNAFSDKISIITGLLHHHKDFHNLNVKYATLMEPWVFTGQKIRGFFNQDLPKEKLLIDDRITNDYRNHMKNSNDINFFVNLSNLLSIKGKNVHYLYKDFPTEKHNIDESFRKFELFSGSFYTSLSLAYFFGFSEVYLIGHDAWTIKPKRNIRFYEHGEGRAFANIQAHDQQLEAYKSKMEIYTISPNGKSINVKNVNYEDFTGKKIKYKENHDILRKKSLELLSLHTSQDIE